MISDNPISNLYRQLMETPLFTNYIYTSGKDLDQIISVRNQLAGFIGKSIVLKPHERTVLEELKNRVKKALIFCDNKENPTQLTKELIMIKNIAQIVLHDDVLTEQLATAKGISHLGLETLPSIPLSLSQEQVELPIPRVNSQSRLLPTKVTNRLKKFAEVNLRTLQLREVSLTNFALQQHHQALESSKTEFEIGLAIIKEEVRPEKNYATTLVQGKRHNRSERALPFFYNQVGNKDVNDYINASYIKLGGKRYIATQGPIKTAKYDTVDDFYHMLSDVGANTVVSLAMPEENGELKCAPWWNPILIPKKPLKDGSTFELKSFQILPLEVKDNPFEQELVKREFILKKPEVGDKILTRLITQFHLRNWPDGGLPHLDVLERLIKELMGHTISGPLIVHCSAGVGRTGCFLLCLKNYEFVYDLLMKSEMDPSVIFLNFLKDFVDLRTQRTRMVATAEQYNVSKQLISRLYKHPV